MAALKGILTVSIFAMLMICAVCSDDRRFFHFDGDMTEFDEVHAEHQGTITYAKDEVYSSPSTRSLSFTQIFDPTYSGRYHSEITLYNAYKPGESGYYGLAFKLPDNWQYSDDTMTIMQFIGDFNDWEETDAKEGELKGKGWSPSTKVWIKGNQLFTRIRSGSVLKEETEWQYLSDVSRGSWHTLVLGVDWSDTTDGAFRAWYDGKLVCTKKHVATTMKADDRPYQLRVGLYATDWHNHANAMKGSQTKKTIYIDKVSMGNSYEEVAPDIWECCDKCHQCKEALEKIEDEAEEKERKEEELEEEKERREKKQARWKKEQKTH